MEHYKAWGEWLRDTVAVLQGGTVQQVVRLNFGAGMNHAIDNFIRRFAMNGTEKLAMMGWLDKFRANVVRSTLAIKPALSLKQYTSFAAFYDAVPIKDIPVLSKYMVEYWTHPIKNYRMLKESSTMFKYRGQNTERDIKATQQTPIFKKWKAKQSFLNTLMVNIHFGDQGAIAWGGWAYYKYLTKKGLSHEEAIKKFEAFSSRTQQSSDETEQSIVQSGSSLTKLLTMYQTSPIQYLRKEIDVLRNFAAGRASTADVAKTLAIFHLLLPMLFQWVSDRFEWEEEEQARAAILGPLNSIFLIGEGLSHIVGRLTGTQFNNTDLPIYAPFKDLGKALKALEPDGDISDEDIYKAVRNFASTTGYATGLPLKQVVDLSGGVKKVVEGDVEEGLTQLIGYSPYIAEKASRE